MGDKRDQIISNFALSADPPQTLSPALPAGHLLKEYSLLSVLGMGAFGITYLAADNYLHLKVAIKEYFPSSAAVRNQFSGAVALKSEQAQAEYMWGKDRFMREAQTLARFRHKNIVQVFRYFEGNETCYMVMAYEEGMSLEQALTENTILWDEQSTLALIMPLLDGLDAVHQAGFLHRDIKPNNIVLRANGEGPVLIDFGAARSPASAEELTVVLSHGFGPPEQYSRQGNQGPWTDIYSMAGVLYRIVTGNVPPLSLHRIRNDVMIPATYAGEGRFSAGFLGAIDLALAVDETRRPQSIGEWRQLLTRGAAAGAMSGATGAAIASAPGKEIERSRVAQSVKPRTTRRMEEEVEPGWLGRLGQAMIAHPFVTLLFLLASLFMAMHLSRRSGSKEPPTPPAIPATAVESRIVVPPPAPSPAPSAEPPVNPPVPAENQTPPKAEPASKEPSNADGRRVGPPAEAFTACSGKFAGARCSFIFRGNDSLDGSCAGLPDGSLACKPERGAERGDRPRALPPPRQEGYQNPADNRLPRYR